MTDAGASPSQSTDPVQPPAFSQLSYSKQYDEIFSKPLNPKKVVPKPDRSAQAQEPGATKVFNSDVYGVPKRNFFFGREWNATDISFATVIAGMHLLALAAPFTFSWQMVGLFAGMYFISGCLGITLSYHRCAPLCEGARRVIWGSAGVLK